MSATFSSKYTFLWWLSRWYKEVKRWQNLYSRCAQFVLFLLYENDIFWVEHKRQVAWILLHFIMIKSLALGFYYTKLRTKWKPWCRQINGTSKFSLLKSVNGGLYVSPFVLSMWVYSNDWELSVSERYSNRYFCQFNLT